MTEPITCEARLMGLSKTRRKDGDWVEIKFHIHPDDHPAALFILPLGTDCNLAISGVPESKDDAPDPLPRHDLGIQNCDDAPDEPVKLRGGDRARRAGIYCNNADFQHYMKCLGPPVKCFPPDPPSGHMSEEAANARDLLLKNCFAQSMRHLDHDDSAGEAFDHIEQQWRRTEHGETTEAFEAMKGEGPG